MPTVRKEKFSVFNFLTFSDNMTTSQAPATQDPLAIEFDGETFYFLIVSVQRIFCFKVLLKLIIDSVKCSVPEICIGNSYVILK